MCEHSIVAGQFPLYRITCANCGQEFHIKFRYRVLLALPLWMFMAMLKWLTRYYKILDNSLVFILIVGIALSFYIIKINILERFAIKKGIINRFIEEDL